MSPDTSKAESDLFIGNLVQCDNPHLVLTFLENADGKKKVVAHNPNDGALVGKHTVTITKRVKVDSEKVPGALHVETGISSLDPQHTVEVLIANFLPERYGDFQRTPLSANVSAAGGNDFTFELADWPDKP